MADHQCDQSSWADSPIKLIPTPVYLTKNHDLFTQGASHMCQTHNTIIRGYNSIYRQAPAIVEGDRADFVGYCLTWHKFVMKHTENEDSSLFPRIEQLLSDESIFSESLKEHDAFMSGLDKFGEYLKGLESTSHFQGSALVEIMSEMQSPLEQHLNNEVTLIASLARHPNVPQPGSQLERDTAQEFDNREGKNFLLSGPSDVVPFFLYNFDRGYEEGIWADWPPMPTVIRWSLTTVAWMRYPGWWKFASCDAKGRPKQLHVLPEHTGAAGII